MNLSWLAPTITAFAGAVVTVGTFWQNRKIIKQQAEAKAVQEEAKAVTDMHTTQLCDIKQAVETQKGP